MKSLLMLTCGIVIGVGVSWTYHKNKYEKLVQEDIDSIREHMDKRNSDSIPHEVVNVEEVEDVKDVEEIIDETKEKMKKIISHSKYSGSEKDEYGVAAKYERPCIVTPDEFASISGFDTATFYYTSNNCLITDDGELVEDVVGTFGMELHEIKDQFGVYEQDAVYVRDMKLKMDYEILWDEQEYKSRN